MDPTRPVASPSPQIIPNSSSLGAQTPTQPFPIPGICDNEPFSSIWGSSTPTLNHPQRVPTHFAATTSFIPTPPIASSLMQGPPHYMQHSTTPSLAMYPQDPAFVPVPSSCTPDEKPKKVPRPPNAFMLFRSWLIRHGMLPPEVKRCQQNISKIAGKAWNMLDESSKDEWRKEAFQRLQDHERHYPDRKFDLLPNNCRTGPKGVGRVVKNAKEDTARRLKPLSDVHARGHRAAGTKRPRRERALPYKFPVAECTPHGPTRGYQTPQSTSNVQSGSSSMSPMTSSNPPSSYSTQAFSLSPLDAQPNTLTHGIPQQPLPYAFFSLGLPNHFEQAYEQEDGTVVFSDNYAPINPFSPPPGYYTGMFPMANPSQMVIGPSTDTPATILSPNEQSPPHAYLNLNTSGGRTRSPIHRPPAVFSSFT